MFLPLFVQNFYIQAVNIVFIYFEATNLRINDYKTVFGNEEKFALGKLQISALLWT